MRLPPGVMSDLADQAVKDWQDDPSPERLERVRETVDTFVCNLAYEYRKQFSRECGLQDLKQVGWIAVEKCLIGWDRDKTKFSTYAGTAIRRRIERYLNKIHKSSTPWSKRRGGTHYLESRYWKQDAEAVDARIDAERFLRLLGDESPVKVEIIKQAYGWDSEALTHREIGERLGYSRGWVQKQFKDGMRRIQQFAAESA